MRRAKDAAGFTAFVCVLLVGGIGFFGLMSLIGEHPLVLLVVPLWIFIFAWLANVVTDWAA